MKTVKIVLKAIPYVFVSLFWIFVYGLTFKKKSRIKVYRKVKKFLGKVSSIFGIEYIVDGNEYLTVEQSYLLTPNHQALIDPFIFFHVFNDPLSFVCKKEVEKIPAVNSIVNMIDGKYLERDNLRQEIKIMKSIQKDMKDKNVKYIVFPEGTRTKKSDLSLNEFKPGAFKYTMDLGKNIYPVAIYGTRNLFDNKCKMKKYRVRVSILPPITKEMYQNMTTSQVATLVQNKIQARLNELIALENA